MLNGYILDLILSAKVATDMEGAGISSEDTFLEEGDEVTEVFLF